MIRLNLTSTPSWLTLAAGLRLNVVPLTTALMVSARADPAIEALADTATQEELALAMAKAVAPCWIGRASAMTRAMLCRSPPKASTPFWKSGRSSRPSRPDTSPKA